MTRYRVIRTWYVDADGPVAAIQATIGAPHEEVAALHDLKPLTDPSDPRVAKACLRSLTEHEATWRQRVGDEAFDTSVAMWRERLKGVQA